MTSSMLDVFVTKATREGSRGFYFVFEKVKEKEMSTQMKDPQNNNQPKLQGRYTFRRQLQYEFKRFPFLVLYPISVFEWIVIQHPMIHLLVLPTLMMLVTITISNLLEYLFRVWTHGPSEPVTFPWRQVGEDLLIFIFPYVFLALLMWLNHYPW